MSDYDVVIIGSGVAALSAALTASELGAGVLVIEGSDVTGGSSWLSCGHMMGAGTRIQREAGIQDSAEELYRHYMSLNHWALEPTLVSRLAEESGPAIDWLEDLGVMFHPKVFFPGDENVPRDHVPVGAGMGVVAVLEAECRARPNVDIATGKRVRRLLTDGDADVGVSAGGDDLRADSVIIATGGFGANPAAVRQHYPRATDAGNWLWYVGPHTARGDALELAAQLDAQVIGSNRGLLLLSPHFGQGIDIYLPGWLVVVNGQGHRFFDETSPYSTTEAVVGAQPNPIYAVFDDGAKHAARRSTAAQAQRQQLPVDTGLLEFQWIEPLIDKMIEKGVVRQAHTISALAEQIGLPAENLTTTITRYNSDVIEGQDSSYLKPVDQARPLTTPPFYATELRLSLLCVTSTGLRIDRDARVINQRNQPIPGLYAAGECTGGILGDTYIGTGNSYTNCLVFGRVAGRTATSHIPRRSGI